MTETILKMQKKVKRYLDKDRYDHTIGVMHTAGCLAMRYGANLEQALTAGLLHDCAKCVPADEKIKLCEKIISKFPMQSTKIRDFCTQSWAHFLPGKNME